MFSWLSRPKPTRNRPPLPLIVKSNISPYDTGMKQVLAILALVAVFVASSAMSAHYADQLNWLVQASGSWSMVGFVIAAFLSEVLAPLTSVPLLPAAVHVWGVPTTVLLATVGWSLGALVAFWLARKFGRPLVKNLVNLEEVDRWSTLIPVHHQFAGILILRLALPADIISYALGLVDGVSFRIYAPSTVLGIAGSAAIYANAATLPLLFQALLLLFVGILIWLGIRHQHATIKRQAAAKE